MRVHYVPINEKQWIHHIQRGGGFIGVPYQRGAGLGSVFRSLFRAILPIAKTAGRAVGKRALKAGAEIASDLVSGRDLKSTLKERSSTATADLLNQAAAKMKGGKKRSSIKGRPKKKKIIRKKRTVKTQLGVIRL